MDNYEVLNRDDDQLSDYYYLVMHWQNETYTIKKRENNQCQSDIVANEEDLNFLLKWLNNSIGYDNNYYEVTLKFRAIKELLSKTLDSPILSSISSNDNVILKRLNYTREGSALFSEKIEIRAEFSEMSWSQHFLENTVDDFEQEFDLDGINRYSLSQNIVDRNKLFSYK